MGELASQFKSLQAQISGAVSKLNLEQSRQKKASIDAEVQAPDFWSNPQHAQNVVREQSKLSKRIEPWDELQRLVDDGLALAEMNDEELDDELQKQLQKASAKFDQLKSDLKMSGPHDDNDVILNIFAGAGGTDAQDWAQMLMRMYIRWAEAADIKVQIIDESAGDEAGIKSVTIELIGDYVYGKLKGEHGVHRLVRLSPFNADNLRQTSFAKVDILPKIDKPEDVEIDDKDLRIDVYRSGGHGGQSVNTTDSAVRVTHLPTNIVVAIQNERSQLQNKETAMTILRSKLAQLQMEQHQEQVSSLKGPNQSAEWGNQIRSYVLHPYKQVKDLRTRHESSEPDAVLGGKLDDFIEAYLDYSLGDTTSQ